MSKGIFVTATDTGVGKTVAAAALIRSLRLAGIKAGGMKPFETGLALEAGELVSADGAFLRRAAEMDDSMELVTPQRFETPLSPYVASAREGAPVCLDSVFNAYERLSRKYEFMVVEGAGGILVPILRRQGDDTSVYYMIDLIRDLKLAAVVVVRPLLGTINHTLLTVSRLLDEGVSVAGIIVSHSEPPQGSVAEETNVQALEELCPVPLIAELPYIGEVTIEKIDKMVKDCRGAIYRALMPI
jgi:dethiobiotin synthetase